MSAARSTALTAEDVWHDVGVALHAFVRGGTANPDQADDVFDDLRLRIREHLGNL